MLNVFYALMTSLLFPLYVVAMHDVVPSVESLDFAETLGPLIVRHVKQAKTKFDIKKYKRAATKFLLLDKFIDGQVKQCSLLEPCQVIVNSYLGVMFQLGLGVEVNKEEAKERILKASSGLSRGNIIRYQTQIETNNQELDNLISDIFNKDFKEFYSMYQKIEFGQETDLYNAVQGLFWRAARCGSQNAMKACQSETSHELQKESSPFVQAQKNIVGPDDAYKIAILLNGLTSRKEANNVIYKWLSIAAELGSKEAKELLEYWLKLGQGDLISASDENKKSIIVIRFYLLADLAFDGHNQSQIDLEWIFKKPGYIGPQPYNLVNVIEGAFSENLKKACEQLPWLKTHKFPGLGSIERQERRVVEIFLCCAELPTEVIWIILAKLPLYTPGISDKSY